MKRDQEIRTEALRIAHERNKEATLKDAIDEARKIERYIKDGMLLRVTLRTNSEGFEKPGKEEIERSEPYEKREEPFGGLEEGDRVKKKGTEFKGKVREINHRSARPIVVFWEMSDAHGHHLPDELEKVEEDPSNECEQAEYPFEEGEKVFASGFEQNGWVYMMDPIQKVALVKFKNLLEGARPYYGKISFSSLSKIQEEDQ